MFFSYPQANLPLFGQKNRETQELCKLLCSQRAFFRHLQKRKMNRYRDKMGNKTKPVSYLQIYIYIFFYTYIQNIMLLNQLKSMPVQCCYNLHCPVLRLSFPPHCEIAVEPPSHHCQILATYKKTRQIRERVAEKERERSN